MPRPPHPRKAEALAYLAEHPADIEGAARLIGVTPDAVRRWLPQEARRGRGERGPDRQARPLHGETRRVIAELLYAYPEAGTGEIAAAAETTGQWVRRVRQEIASDGE